MTDGPTMTETKRDTHIDHKDLLIKKTDMPQVPCKSTTRRRMETGEKESRQKNSDITERRRQRITLTE